MNVKFFWLQFHIANNWLQIESIKYYKIGAEILINYLGIKY